MLSDVIEYLECPVCSRALGIEEGTARCASGHSFDIARQGYLNLLPGDARPGTADTPEMVAARSTFLEADHFDFIADGVAAAAAAVDPFDVPGCVVDIGAGTGHYLARTLDALPRRAGVAIDISKFAARRSAKAHDRIGSVVSDAWQRIPLRTSSAAVVLNVFAPRNPLELHRVLHPSGALLVVVPDADHMHEVIEPLGLLGMEEDKLGRVDEKLAGRFKLDGRQSLRSSLSLSADELRAMIEMGPSARHLDAQRLTGMLDRLGRRTQVTASVVLSRYSPKS